MSIRFRVNQAVPVTKFVDLLERSGLAEWRPVHDLECIQGMLIGSNLLVTAWDRMKLIGAARSLTDFHYVCYLSDLAVDREYQRQGFGRELIARSQKLLGRHCRIVLLPPPAAADYCRHIGFERSEDCWILEPDNRLE